MPKADALSLFVFIDALGHRLMERHDFAPRLLPVRAPLESILGYSCTCDPTILTGRMPRDHGHFSFFAFDPAHSPFGLWRWLGLLPRPATDRMRVRGRLSRLVQRGLGYTGYFHLYNVPFDVLPLLDYTEKRDLYEPGGINAGCPTIFDHLRAQRVPYFLSDWRRPEAPNLAALETVLDRGQVRFAYLYMAELDAILHADGTGSARGAAKIRGYGEALERLLRRAERRYREVRLFVFSDHGMTDVVRHAALKPRIEALGLRYGVDYAAVYDSTLARFYFLTPAARAPIEAVLAAEPHGHVLSPAELRHYGCDFADGRYGELFFLVDPGTLIVPSYMGLRHVPGMHGYAPDHVDSVAGFAANVPLASLPRRLDDLFGLMMREAGLGAARA